MPKGNLLAIAAMARRRVIGRGGALPWYRMPSDMKRFKDTTIGHSVLMGWKTFDSILQRSRGNPLWGRENIVLTSHHATKVTEHGGIPIASIEEVLGDESGRLIFVIGGQQVFELALPYISTIYMTQVNANLEGDAYFPRIDTSEWEIVTREGPRRWDPSDEYDSEVIQYHRR